MNQVSKNPFTLLRDVVLAPSSAFATVYHAPKLTWLPYFLLLLSSFILWNNYFQDVNFHWLHGVLSQQLSMTPEEQSKWLVKGVLLASEFIKDFIGRTAMILLMAAWLKIATKPSQHQHSYWKWVAASTLIFLPMLIGDLASYVNFSLSNDNITMAAMDLNSLNGLLKLAPTSHWIAYCSSFPLLMPWYIVLTYAALGTWTDFDKAKSLVIAALPWLFIYTLWPIVILFSY
ncbi:YIP1 family protein [Vibrio sp. SS-MA-C1-2]|uniref:YIP1 family protein n=1 Tax=Vibrio sp. SS-MA-C1-2 TaxID=2908646 RepID=UPI001F24A924|nr:YIP1 family protein [Vibrio sp. SS-MA-C1-2]UJF19770.1 YIP1 family protein [Vibrio sp. SS-MA-C1-2]